MEEEPPATEPPRAAAAGGGGSGGGGGDGSAAVSAAAKRAGAVLPPAKAKRLQYVRRRHGRRKPYQVRMWRGGKLVSLGSFVTAEEAALCVARSPEGQAAAAERTAEAAPLTSEEALQQAQAEELVLCVADNKSGYFGVHLDKRSKTKPYDARVKRGVARTCTLTASPPPRRRRCAWHERQRGRRRRSGLQRRCS